MIIWPPKKSPSYWKQGSGVRASKRTATNTYTNTRLSLKPFLVGWQNLLSYFHLFGQSIIYQSHWAKLYMKMISLTFFNHFHEIQRMILSYLWTVTSPAIPQNCAIIKYNGIFRRFRADTQSPHWHIAPFLQCSTCL